jgi:RNA polymerase sigma-70 factor (ECF subfamily)
MTSSSEIPASSKRTAFAATHWSVVLAASDDNTSQARRALACLCEAYWYPLYAYARRCGHSPEDAQDLTQAFFAQLIGHNWVAHADPHKGRFRSFLLMIMKRFLAKEWEKAKTLKRGGQASMVALELDSAETRYSLELADTSTPEQLFEKQWALTLLESVLKRLRGDYARDGKGALFEALEPCLVGSRETQPYAELAAELGMTEGAVKVAVCRLRERYRSCLKEEIAQTVASPAEAEDELRHLFRVLAR